MRIYTEDVVQTVQMELDEVNNKILYRFIAENGNNTVLSLTLIEALAMRADLEAPIKVLTERVNNLPT